MRRIFFFPCFCFLFFFVWCVLTLSRKCLIPERSTPHRDHVGLQTRFVEVSTSKPSVSVVIDQWKPNEEVRTLFWGLRLCGVP